MNMSEVRRSFYYPSEVIYLDNAATTQPLCAVLDRMERYEKHGRANIHRGIYALGRRCEGEVLQARRRMEAFLCGGGVHQRQVVYTGGATAALNLVAMGLRKHLGPGDEVIVSSLEHHSNFVPWQQLCIQCGATLRVVPLAHREWGGGFSLEAYQNMLTPKTRVVAVTQASNVTGELLPVEKIYQLAKQVGALVVVDGAQGIRQLNPGEVTPFCDFYCFSAHKLFGPMGVGVLCAAPDGLEELEPICYGGGMVDRVTAQGTTYAPLPQRLEAGTIHAPGIVGLDEAIAYLKGAGTERIAAWEDQLTKGLVRGLLAIPGVHVLADSAGRRLLEGETSCHVVSFWADEVDCFDLTAYLDQRGICVRQGTHCAQPALEAYGVPAVIRASPALYNTQAEIERFLNAVEDGIQFFKGRVQRWGAGQ